MKKEKLIITKIGGNVLNKEAILANVLKDFVDLKEKKILIHGGGRRADTLMIQMGIEPQMVDGRRITDAATLEICTMVYAGLINKEIVADLQALGCNAIGLTGADVNAIRAYKRPVKNIDYGFVGDIDSIESKNISKLLEVGFTPVFCAITHDKQGQLLNTNADSIASFLATGMSDFFDVTLILCFEKDGVLSDPNDDTSVIPSINFQQFQEFKASGVISAGMIPKLDGAFHALQTGVEKVIIAGTNVLNNPNKNGTHLCL